MNTHGQDEDFYKGASVFLAFVVTVLLVILFFNMKNDSNVTVIDSNGSDDTTSVEEGKKNIPDKSKRTTCIDVTSYDYNWKNDVLCTRPDGSKFYTDYAGGRRNDSNFQQD